MRPAGAARRGPSCRVSAHGDAAHLAGPENTWSEHRPRRSTEPGSSNAPRQETCYSPRMATTWIVAADSSRARILQVMDRDERLAEIEDLLNPEGRVHDRDLLQDSHPRFSGTSGPASDREEMSATEHATELFAKRVSDYLDKARNDHRYDRL